MNDRARDGTAAYPQGEKNGNSKLTEEQVREIRDNPDNKTAKLLAENYGVTQQAINNITSRRSWKHL